MRESGFFGFANPVDPKPDELTSWAYHPEAVPLDALPANWDLLLAGDALAPTLFDLALDRSCPARRFALHCLYIYAADSVRHDTSSHRRRRLKKFVVRAKEVGDEQMATWAHNCLILIDRPELFDYHDWCEGGLVRHPRKLSLFDRR